MNVTLRKKLRRQSELAAKALAGELSEIEKAELGTLTAAIKTAMDPPVIAMKTKLTTMTLAEFKTWADGVMGGDGASADELALVKRNVEAVKSQGKTAAGDIVAVEMAIETSAAEGISALEDRIVMLEQKLSDTAKGQNDQTGDEPSELPFAKLDAPTTMALALEAMDAVMRHVGELKAKFDAGTVTIDDVEKLWPNWDLRNVIEAATSVMAKLDETKALVSEVLPKVEKLKSDDSAGDGAGDADGDADGAGDADGDGDGAGDADDDSAGDVVKTAFFSGGDVSPKPRSGVEDRKHLKKASDADRIPGLAYK